MYRPDTGDPNRFESNSGGTFATSATGWSTIFNGDGTQNINFTNVEGSTNGSYAATFNAGNTNGVGTLYQAFDTVPGTTYNVSFDFGAFANAPNTGVTQQMSLGIRDGASPTAGAILLTAGSAAINNGTNQGETLSVSNNVLQLADSIPSGVVVATGPNAEFSSIAFSFTAISATSNIQFNDNTGTPTVSNDGVLDNVAVSAVPEPTTLGLIGVAAAGILGRRRRNAR